MHTALSTGTDLEILKELRGARHYCAHSAHEKFKPHLFLYPDTPIPYLTKLQRGLKRDKIVQERAVSQFYLPTDKDCFSLGEWDSWGGGGGPGPLGPILDPPLAFN